MSVFKRNELFKVISLLMMLLCTSSLFGADYPTLWEGSAAIGAYGILPVRGLYGASNSFPRNTLVVVENLENGTSAEIFIVDRLENSSYLVLLSQEAGEALGIGASGVIRVRGTLGSADKTDSYALNSDQVYSRDPDVNPSAAVELSAAELGDTEEILANSIFPVDNPVTPLVSEAGPAEPVIIEETTEQIVIEEPVEPQIVETEETPVKEEEPIEITGPKAELAEKEVSPPDPKKDPVVDVADETLGTPADEINTEVSDEVVTEDLPSPEIAEIEELAADADNEPELAPVEYEPASEPELTYISEEITAPASVSGSIIPPEINLPGVNEISAVETPEESIAVTSYPMTRPETGPVGALFTTQLPREPEIITGRRDAAESLAERPLVESPGYIDLEADEFLPEPAIPRIREFAGAASLTMETESEEAPSLLRVDSGYLLPEAAPLGAYAAAAPVQPEEETPDLNLAMDNEVPSPINGYLNPGIESVFQFGAPAIPVDPSIVSLAENVPGDDQVLQLFSGMPVPGRIDAERFGQVAIPEEPAAAEALAESEEVPGVINGFLSPGEIGSSVSLAAVSLPEEPAEAEPDTPHLINGFISPETGLIGEFAAADAPEVPAGVEEDIPIVAEGYTPPKGGRSGRTCSDVRTGDCRSRTGGRT